MSITVERFGMLEMYITEEEHTVATLANKDIRCSKQVLDLDGKFYYVYYKTSELEKVLDELPRQTTTVVRYS